MACPWGHLVWRDDAISSTQPSGTERVSSDRRESWLRVAHSKKVDLQMSGGSAWQEAFALQHFCSTVVVQVLGTSAIRDGGGCIALKLICVQLCSRLVTDLAQNAFWQCGQAAGERPFPSEADPMKDSRLGLLHFSAAHRSSFSNGTPAAGFCETRSTEQLCMSGEM
jgi:hypothetical protein